MPTPPSLASLVTLSALPLSCLIRDAGITVPAPQWGCKKGNTETQLRARSLLHRWNLDHTPHLSAGEFSAVVLPLGNKEEITKSADG